MKKQQCEKKASECFKTLVSCCELFSSIVIFCNFLFLMSSPALLNTIRTTMAFNSSTLPQHAHTNSSLSPLSTRCLNHRVDVLIFTIFAITNILVLLPLSILVFYLGLQQWRKRFSGPGAVSHSDAITYHMIIVELIGVLGCGCFCCGAYFGLLKLTKVGLFLYSITAEGHTSFHILSCVDRLLAVVHPITYLGLKQRGGIMMRNVIIGSAWLFFAIFAVCSQFFYHSAANICTLLLSTLVTSFCCLSVLRSLNRPGPGARRTTNQSKKMALNTIMAITGALMWRFGGYLSVLLIYSFSRMSEDVRCALLISGVWFSLPSSMVLPLLYLHRARKIR